jgi:hypothetical protein
MRGLKKIKDTEEDRARAQLLAHFEDNPQSVFYSRQLEVMLEREYFHWVTNRALRRVGTGGPPSHRDQGAQYRIGNRHPRSQLKAKWAKT